MPIVSRMEIDRIRGRHCQSLDLESQRFADIENLLQHVEALEEHLDERDIESCEEAGDCDDWRGHIRQPA